LPRQCFQKPDATEYSYRWAEIVKQNFQENAWRVFDLAADDAIRTEVENYLQNPRSYVFLFYGHGLPNQMLGQDGIPVIDLDNLHLLKNQKVYVVACHTAETLGPATVNSAFCYLGYDDCIIVWLIEPYATHLENCINKGILRMLNIPDCTIKQARQSIIDEYNNWIDHFTIGTGVLDLRAVAFAADLRHNRDAVRLFGDRTATLTN